MIIEEQDADDSGGARLVSNNAAPQEEAEELSLRPRRLADFIGQDKIKEQLLISLTAAKGRGETLEHVLLYGNPGLGKTTLAYVIANEMDTNLKVTSGPALEKVGDLAAILSSLEKGDILFIDEIHRLNRTIEEVLYSAMEDCALDIVVGKGPGARTLRVPLEKFTLIGATTRASLLSGPLRDRFGHVFHLDFYENQDIQKIVDRNAGLLNVEIEPGASVILSERSRRTPRVANRLLRRLRDYAQVKGRGIISLPIAEEGMELLKIDSLGLDEVDRKILSSILSKFGGGPVGLGTLSATVAEDEETIETVYEPFLLRLGLLNRTPRGREVTALAKEHLGITQVGQNKLFS